MNKLLPFGGHVPDAEVHLLSDPPSYIPRPPVKPLNPNAKAATQARDNLWSNTSRRTMRVQGDQEEVTQVFSGTTPLAGQLHRAFPHLDEGFKDETSRDYFTRLTETQLKAAILLTITTPSYHAEQTHQCPLKFSQNGNLITVKLVGPLDQYEDNTPREVTLTIEDFSVAVSFTTMTGKLDFNFNWPVPGIVTKTFIENGAHQVKADSPNATWTQQKDGSYSCTAHLSSYFDLDEDILSLDCVTSITFTHFELPPHWAFQLLQECNLENIHWKSGNGNRPLGQIKYSFKEGITFTTTGDSYWEISPGYSESDYKGVTIQIFNSPAVGLFPRPDIIPSAVLHLSDSDVIELVDTHPLAKALHELRPPYDRTIHRSGYKRDYHLGLNSRQLKTLVSIYERGFTPRYLIPSSTDDLPGLDELSFNEIAELDRFFFTLKSRDGASPAEKRSILMADCDTADSLSIDARHLIPTSFRDQLRITLTLDLISAGLLSVQHPEGIFNMHGYDSKSIFDTKFSQYPPHYLATMLAHSNAKELVISHPIPQQQFQGKIKFRSIRSVECSASQHRSFDSALLRSGVDSISLGVSDWEMVMEEDVTLSGTLRLRLSSPDKPVPQRLLDKMLALEHPITVVLDGPSEDPTSRFGRSVHILRLNEDGNPSHETQYY